MKKIDRRALMGGLGAGALGSLNGAAPAKAAATRRIDCQRHVGSRDGSGLAGLA